MTIADLLQPAGGGVAVQNQPQSVGVKANTPQSNLATPNKTLPSNQVAPTDLSSRYANVGGTIYDTQDKVKFSNPNDFFTSAKNNGFNVTPGNWNIKWGSYTPVGDEQIYGQVQQPQSVQSSTQSPNFSSNTNQTQTQPISQPQNTQNNTNQPNNQPYTPPNGGTTGVSQGGIIGNLINNANTASSGAAQQLQKDRQALLDATNSYATSVNNVESQPIDLSLATGEKGLLSRLFAAKQGALQTAISNDISLLNAGTQAGQSAGQLNAPITGVPYGTQTISPSQPATGTPYGQAATSGAMNVSSLIGQRPSPSNPKVTEFYNTQTGQGFSDPQQLADFVNKQFPGANANAQNVFQVLQGLQNGVSGNGGALNPINQVSSIAQQVISGQISPSQAYQMGGSVNNWQSLLNAEIQRQSPGFDTAGAEGRYQANQQNTITSGTSTTSGASDIYKKALSDYSDLQAKISNIYGFGQQIITNMPTGVNPSDAPILNNTIQYFLNNFASNPQYSKLATNVQGFQARVSDLLNMGEIPSAATAGAQAIANGTLPVSSMAAVIQQIENEAGTMLQTQQAKVQQAYNAMQGSQSSFSNNSNSGAASQLRQGAF